LNTVNTKKLNDTVPPTVPPGSRRFRDRSHDFGTKCLDGSNFPERLLLALLSQGLEKAPIELSTKKSSMNRLTRQAVMKMRGIRPEDRRPGTAGLKGTGHVAAALC
jgi:hypothetical protein